jgi:multiple sugar transport system substrate-binding protein
MNPIAGPDRTSLETSALAPSASKRACGYAGCRSSAPRGISFARASSCSGARCCRPSLLILLSYALLAGCNRSPAGAIAHSARPARGRIVINFWNGFTGPDGKTMQQMVDRFRERNPDVDVHMQIIPWGAYYDKLTLSLAYGGAPDVFIVHASRLPEFASFDTLHPLAALFAAERPPLTAADFAPVPWKATFYKGRQLAMPLDVHPMGMYYNTRLFREAGIVDAGGTARPPRTGDEFLADARKLTRDTNGDGRPDQWGFVITYQRTNWLTFVGQFGGGILTPNLQRCAMDTPETLAGTRALHDLIDRYHVAPAPEGVDAWLAFRQGKVGMAFEGIYMLASLEEQKGLAFAGAPVPRFGPHPAVWGGSHLLCQPAAITPERSRAAWRLMRFLSNNSLLWAKGGQVPARLAVLHSPEFAALPVQSQFARQLPFVQYEPLTPKDNALFPFVDPAVEAVLLDLQTPEQAMRDACRRVTQVLDRP